MTAPAIDGAAWADGLARNLATAVKRHREARGWSAQRLADECTGPRVGYPISRGVIAKIESGERKQVIVAEWLALAFALDVPPLILLYPFQSDDELAFLPAKSASGPDVLAWLTGQAVGPPTPTADARAAWVRFAPLLGALSRWYEVGVGARGLIEDASSGTVDLASPREAESVELALSRARHTADSLRSRFAENDWPQPPDISELQELADALSRFRLRGDSDASVME